MKAFDNDSSLMKSLSLLTDVMFVGILWIFSSLLIITIGASTTAAYYVLMRRISNRESSILSDYFSSFKSNFKNSTIVFVIIVVSLTINYLNILFNPVSGNLGIIIYGLQIIIIIELVFLYVHVFPIIARFDSDLKQAIKTAIILANKHLFTTITHGALLVAVLWLCFNAPVIFVIAPGLYYWLSSYMLIKIYRKYKPDMDMDSDLSINANESDTKTNK